LFRSTVLLGLAAVSCSVYANLSLTVTDPADYRFFPPFEVGVNRNRSRDLGVEYFCIARAMAAGRGFADPFGEPTGPTAWMPPVLPTLLAGLLWLFGGDRDAVMVVVLVLQNLVLIGTALLVLALADRTNGRLGLRIASWGFLAILLAYFFECFQYTHDFWLVLAALDLLIAGLCWGRPLGSWARATCWGAFGGLCALVSPVVGLTWLIVSAAVGWRGGGRTRLAAAALVAALTVSPWLARNYAVFGRVIPVKSNLGYELYQSQCLGPDGVLRRAATLSHPYKSADGPERRDYKALGETAFMDRKWKQFGDAVRARPWDSVRRVSDCFLAATLVYEPFDPMEGPLPWWMWLARVAYLLPFGGLLVLLLTARRSRLEPAQWVVIGVYVVYLLPYIGASYYDHYGAPLLGVKVLLAAWGLARLLEHGRCDVARTHAGSSSTPTTSDVPAPSITPSSALTAKAS
jgi:hypothetical protein